ncbi:DUF1796 family putative cysteine peptidase [Bacillus wiedmannii]|uniref:DUF1796 family putative cysteine peptidase n=1 Tax=Bacillus wiedmannii TaxID=1890302 RepID=UPI0015CF4F05|nr:DUF1796 family putative cysteine peptidase [Bacillus wiedmannii]
MKLIDIQQNYNTIFSLGNSCLTAIKLRQFKLRPYAGIIDWMLSPNLLAINNLLKNRCENFMEKETMVCDGYNTLIYGHLLLRDLLYDVTSVHDFSIIENTITDWNTYKNFKIKIKKRIQRFLNKLETCNRILFVRIGGTYEEAKLLEQTLTQIVTHEFRLLIINEEFIDWIIEYNWNLQYTCGIGISIDKRESDELWDVILKNIMCTEISDDFIDIIDD